MVNCLISGPSEWVSSECVEVVPIETVLCNENFNGSNDQNYFNNDELKSDNSNETVMILEKAFMISNTNDDESISSSFSSTNSDTNSESNSDEVSHYSKSRHTLSKLLQCRNPQNLPLPFIQLIPSTPEEEKKQLEMAPDKYEAMRNASPNPVGMDDEKNPFLQRRSGWSAGLVSGPYGWTKKILKRSVSFHR